MELEAPVPVALTFLRQLRWETEVSWFSQPHLSSCRDLFAQTLERSLPGLNMLFADGCVAKATHFYVGAQVTHVVQESRTTGSSTQCRPVRVEA